MAQRRGTTTYGFARTSTLLQQRIRKASESRGFAQTRLLTHWEEIIGPDLAAITRPVDISYGRGGMGATLTILTTGAIAPMVEMQKVQIADKVNACYGYKAIARIRITQTAPTGFAEGQADFTHRAAKPAAKAPAPEVVRAASDLTRPVEDEGLRTALEKLAQNVITKGKR